VRLRGRSDSLAPQEENDANNKTTSCQTNEDAKSNRKQQRKRAKRQRQKQQQQLVKDCVLALKIDTWSRTLFPLAFAAFNVCYWTYYTHGRRKQET